MSSPVSSPRDTAQTTAPLWIRESDVSALLNVREAIELLESALQMEARGRAQNMLKTHVSWAAGHTLHAIGASFADTGFVGTKTWAHTAGGAAPLLILFDSGNGSLKAVIEAFALGQLRTAGITGVATRWLADPAADELAIIGTGKQALAQVSAIDAVRPLRRVRVFSPTAEHRAAFVARLRTLHDFAVIDAPSAAAAVDAASIVTLVTRARAAVVTADLLAPGSHVNAIGAITPERMEFSTDIFPRCTAVVVDNVPTVQQLSREFMDYYGAGQGRWDEVVPLSQIVAQRRAHRRETALTLFKAMGMGIADVALGIAVFERAMRDGLARRSKPEE